MNNKQIRKSLSRAVTDMTPDVFDGVLMNCEQQKQAERTTPNVWKQILHDREQQEEAARNTQVQESAPASENVPSYEIVPTTEKTQPYGIVIAQKTLGHLKSIPVNFVFWTKQMQFGNKAKAFFTNLAERAKQMQFGPKAKAFFTNLAGQAKQNQFGPKVKESFTNLAGQAKQNQFGPKVKESFTNLAGQAKQNQFGSKAKAFFAGIAEHIKKLRFDKRGLAIVGVAAVVLLAVVIPFNSADDSIDSIIGIDANPSIEIRTNKSEKVLSVIPLNDDAKIILDDMVLEDVSLDVTVNALIGSMLKHGYITEKKNSILITVENADTRKGQSLQEHLMSEISKFLNLSALEGAVIGQMVSEDESLRTLAKEHGISIGKAALVKQLTELDTRLIFADIAKLGINEINLLLDARQTNLQGISLSGKANSSAYIGQEQAKSNAFVHAGVLEGAITSAKIEMDYDDGRMVYEVDFQTTDAEYEYEIDATQGTILSFKSEAKETQGQTPETPPHAPPTHPDAYITPEQAKQSALSHAELDASIVTFINVNLNLEGGTPIYDVEFYSGDYEFDYELDAYSGVVIAYDYDIENYPPPAEPQSGEYISKDQAKIIALAHAGFSEGDVRRLRVEADRDGGRVKYEVEFRKDRHKYNYDIDAMTGEIIGVEHGD